MIDEQLPSITDADAAMSLCVMSSFSMHHAVSSMHHAVSPCPPMDMDAYYPTLSPATAAAIALPNVVGEDFAPISTNLPQDFQPTLPTPTNQIPELKSSNSTTALPPANKDTNPRGKYNKLTHNVSLEEMKRLMRVYGPIKCLRNRHTDTRPGAITKDTSIKRKFYRWFPDFGERFELAEGGWFMPKFGHEYEMKYREAMRMSDQHVLIKKRRAKRCGPKSFEIQNGTTVNNIDCKLGH